MGLVGSVRLKPHMMGRGGLTGLIMKESRAETPKVPSWIPVSRSILPKGTPRTTKATGSCFFLFFVFHAFEPSVVGYAPARTGLTQTGVSTHEIQMCGEHERGNLYNMCQLKSLTVNSDCTFRHSRDDLYETTKFLFHQAETAAIEARNKS